jgi:hypothetical protein
MPVELLIDSDGGHILTSGGSRFLVADSPVGYLYTPPTEDTVSNIAFDVPPIWNRLMRYYPVRKRGRATWALPDGVSYSFDQPFPLVTPENKARGDLFSTNQTPPNDGITSISNLNAVTYLKVFYGGATYPVTLSEANNLATFLTANGYNFEDWLVPV